MTRGDLFRAVPALFALSFLVGGCGVRALSADAPEADRQVVMYLNPPASSQLPVQVLTDINLEAGATGRVDLDTGVSVTGQLTLPISTEDGPVDQPIVASVTAIDQQGLVSYEAQTNLTDSTFQLRVPQGTYDLFVNASGSSFHVPPQTFEDIYISSVTDGLLELPSLDPGVPLQVKLLYADGLPLTGARVYTIDEQGALSSSTISAENGVYWIQVQSTHGPQRLWMGPDPEINPPLYNVQIALLQEGSTEPVEFVYGAATYKLTGRVVDELTAPVSDVIVFATRQAAPDDSLSGAYQTQAVTDAQGQFSLPLPEGTYDLLFRPPGTTPTPLSGVRYGSSVVLNQDVRLPSDVVLPPMVTVTVSVKGPDGTAVAGAGLTAVSDDQTNKGPSTLSDAKGEATLTLGVGHYLLEISPPQGSDLAYQVQAVNVQPGMTSLEDIELELGFISTIQFLADGSSLPGLLVQVWEVEYDGTAVGSPIHQLASAVTDENGYARLVLPQY